MAWTRRTNRYRGYTLRATKHHDGWRVWVSNPPGMQEHLIGQLQPTKLMREALSQTKSFMRRHPTWYPNLNPIDTGALRRSIMS